VEQPWNVVHPLHHVSDGGRQRERSLFVADPGRYRSAQALGRVAPPTRERQAAGLSGGDTFGGVTMTIAGQTQGNTSRNPCLALAGKQSFVRAHCGNVQRASAMAVEAFDSGDLIRSGSCSVCVVQIHPAKPGNGRFAPGGSNALLPEQPLNHDSVVR